jgi:hypothetical protein
MLIESFSPGQDQRQWWELLALDPAYVPWSEHVHAREVPLNPGESLPSADSPDGEPRAAELTLPSLSPLSPSSLYLEDWNHG